MFTVINIDRRTDVLEEILNFKARTSSIVWHIRDHPFDLEICKFPKRYSAIHFRKNRNVEVSASRIWGEKLRKMRGCFRNRGRIWREKPLSNARPDCARSGRAVRLTASCALRASG